MLADGCVHDLITRDGDREFHPIPGMGAASLRKCRQQDCLREPVAFVVRILRIGAFLQGHLEVLPFPGALCRYPGNYLGGRSVRTVQPRAARVRKHATDEARCYQLDVGLGP